MFPGLNSPSPSTGEFPSIGAVQQYLGAHFIFVSSRYTAENPELVLISRMGCQGVGGLSVDVASINLEAYKEKPVLITDFEYSFEKGVSIKDIEIDRYVLDHIEEYQKVCSFPFDKITTQTP